MTEPRYLSVIAYADVTIRVRGTYQLDREEYRDWYSENYPWRGDPFDDLDTDEVLEFLNHSPDLVSDVWEDMPDVDTNEQDLIDSELVEVEFA